jgi:hypothetical protein
MPGLQRTSAAPSQTLDVFGKGKPGGTTGKGMKYGFERQPVSLPARTKARDRNPPQLTSNIKKRGGGGKKRSGKKRRASAKFLEASARWRAHLDEYKKAHPNMSLKQQMRGAKKTYNKSQPSSIQVKSKPNRTKRKVKRTNRRTGKKKNSLFNLF